MFYHQNILQRRGQFGIVWLAATKIDQLKRREMSAVNLHKACQDILEFIMVRVQPRNPGGSRPRFSLYLSSQLMYGVIKIYKKQNEYLLDEMSTFFTKIRMSTATLDEINLKGVFRSEFVTNPDLLMNSSQNQQGYDPLFGLLSMDERIPQELSLPDMELWRIESKIYEEKGSSYSSPVIKAIDETRVSDRRSKQDKGSPLTVSSRDDITMKEVEPVPEARFPMQDDLPTFDGKQMEMILEEPDVRLNMAEYLYPIRPVLDTTFQDKNLSRGVLSPKEKTPVTRADEEPQIPEVRPQVLSPGVTPAPTVEERPRRTAKATLNLELSPVVVASPARRRRRDRLLIDEETQISKAQLKENLKTGDDLCVPFVLPDVRRSNVSDLFRRPSQRCLHNKPLIDLWLRNAKYGIHESESDIEAPCYTVPELAVTEEERPPKRRRSSRMSEQLSPEKARADQEISVRLDELPSVELGRDASLSLEHSRAANLTPVSIRRGSVSDHDKSRDSAKEDSMRKSVGKRRRLRGKSIEEEQDLIPPTHLDMDVPSLLQESNLSVVHEEQESQLMISPVKKFRSEEELSPLCYRLIRKINSMTSKEKYVTFSDICPPPTTNRMMASKMFSAILDLTTSKKLNVEQDEPYQEIFICRGVEW